MKNNSNSIPVKYWNIDSYKMLVPGLSLSMEHNVVLGQRFLSHSSQLEPVLSAIISIHQAQLSLYNISTGAEYKHAYIIVYTPCGEFSWARYIHVYEHTQMV